MDKYSLREDVAHPWAGLPHLPLPSRRGYFAVSHPTPSCLACPASWWSQCCLTGSTLQTMTQQWWVLSCRLSSTDPERKREWGNFAAAGKSPAAPSQPTDGPRAQPLQEDEVVTPLPLSSPALIPPLLPAVGLPHLLPPPPTFCQLWYGQWPHPAHCNTDSAVCPLTFLDLWQRRKAAE